MTEKRYKVNIDHHKTSRNYVTGILDCETNVLLDNHTAINNRLNEQHETITRLEKENDELKKELASISQLIDKKIDEFKNGDYGDLPCNTIHMFLDLKQELGDLEWLNDIHIIF